MTKTYKIFFVTGKEITIEAAYAKYIHQDNINKNMLVYYDTDGTVLGTFSFEQILGDMIIGINDNKEEQQSTEAIGFQLPKEEPVCLKNLTE